ncbi:MAG: branched-chain amino acid ABC transporter permease [Desulfosalsimonadaceae bacterium]
MEGLLVILMDGVFYASYLYLVALGLTLIFGVMKILNIAHGSFYGFGAYAGASLVLFYTKQGFWPHGVYLLLVGAALLVGIILGPIIERGIIRRFYREEVVVPLIATYALFLVLDDLMKLIFGTSPYFAYQPLNLAGNFSFGGIPYPVYYLIFISVALVSGLLLWAIMNLTKYGRFVTAVMHDPEISNAMGIKLPRIYLITFTIGAVFAALGGAFTSPMTSVVPGLAVEVIVASFAVVVIGGLGSYSGAAIGALIVGIVRAVAVHHFPVMELFMIYIVMAAILMIRPQGLFPAEEVRRI